jgi:hypothetical protein
LLQGYREDCKGDCHYALGKTMDCNDKKSAVALLAENMSEPVSFSLEALAAAFPHSDKNNFCIEVSEIGRSSLPGTKDRKYPKVVRKAKALLKKSGATQKELETARRTMQSYQDKMKHAQLKEAAAIAKRTAEEARSEKIE